MFDRKSALASLASQLSTADLKKASGLDDAALAALFGAIFPQPKTAKSEALPVALQMKRESKRVAKAASEALASKPVAAPQDEPAEATSPAEALREKAKTMKALSARKAKREKDLGIEAGEPIVLPASMQAGPELQAAFAKPKRQKATAPAAKKSKKVLAPVDAAKAATELASIEAARKAAAKREAKRVAKVAAATAEPVETSLEKARRILREKRAAEGPKAAKPKGPRIRADGLPGWTNSLLKARAVLAAKNAANAAAKAKAQKAAKKAEKAAEAQTAEAPAPKAKASTAKAHAAKEARAKKALSELADRLGFRLEALKLG